MKPDPTTHANHTGLQLHPDLLEEMVDATDEFGPTSHGGAESIAHVRVRYAREADPHGTMPPAARALPAERIAVLDKLGARLAFERTGTRLYEALISKLDAYGTFAGGPTRDDLRHLRDEEHHHAVLAQAAIARLGGDPTAVTPSASLQATASRGVLDVLVDPRTDLVECLETILVAELTDHESWSTLATLPGVADDKELAGLIEQAEETEAEHLEKIRRWIAAARTGGKPRAIRHGQERQ